MRFTASEWARIEHELTRERGLWGPDKPSFLDKWMLDSVEGTVHCAVIYTCICKDKPMQAGPMKDYGLLHWPQADTSGGSKKIKILKKVPHQ